jgi:hypothetical protein
VERTLISWSVGVGRQIARKQPYKGEGTNDPAVGTILAYSGAQVSAAKGHYDRQQDGCDRKGDHLRLRSSLRRSSVHLGDVATKHFCKGDRPCTG